MPGIRRQTESPSIGLYSSGAGGGERRGIGSSFKRDRAENKREKREREKRV